MKTDQQIIPWRELKLIRKRVVYPSSHGITPRSTFTILLLTGWVLWWWGLSDLILIVCHEREYKKNLFSSGWELTLMSWLASWAWCLSRWGWHQNSLGDDPYHRQVLMSNKYTFMMLMFLKILSVLFSLILNLAWDHGLHQKGSRLEIITISSWRTWSSWWCLGSWLLFLNPIHMWK